MMKLLETLGKNTIPPQRGIAFEMFESQYLKVTDLQGEQVADLFCFARNEPNDALSSGRSIDYNDTMLFTKGDILYSQSGLPMLEIMEDTCGRHDFLLTPCSPQMFRMLGSNVYHPSCLENLERAFQAFDVNPAQIATTFNIFMNVPFEQNGKLKVSAPLSRPKDFVIFEAKMDLIVGLTACADEESNNGCCKPIEYEILP